MADASAGAFSDPQRLSDGESRWVEIATERTLRPGMFVARVKGRSMEPMIPDGAYCLFRAPVEGTRQGDSCRHERITPEPLNPAFGPIVLTSSDEGELQVIAELVDVLGDLESE
jgi:hypothetical protein